VLSAGDVWAPSIHADVMATTKEVRRPKSHHCVLCANPFDSRPSAIKGAKPRRDRKMARLLKDPYRVAAQKIYPNSDWMDSLRMSSVGHIHDEVVIIEKRFPLKPFNK
jgi:hypothetical protein